MPRPSAFVAALMSAKLNLSQGNIGQHHVDLYPIENNAGCMASPLLAAAPSWRHCLPGDY